MDSLSRIFNVGQRSVGAGLAAGTFSLVLEGQSITNSLIDAAAMTASDVVGQSISMYIPNINTGGWDLKGSVGTGVVYSGGGYLIGYRGPFNGLFSNFLYGVGCDIVGQSLASASNTVVNNAASDMVHRNHHRTA